MHDIDPMVSRDRAESRRFARLGEPDGIIAFDPSSFPKRGTHSVA
jgi:hypothetical protein